nr:MFS transporter [Nanchangia anserum]
MFATLLVTSVHPLAGLIACALIQVVGGFALIVQRGSEPAPQPRVTEIHTGSVLRSKAIVILGVTYAFAGAIFGALDLATVAFATEHGARPLAGVLLGIVAAGSLIGALVYGSRVWPLSQGRLFVVGITLMAAGNMVILLVHSMATFALVMFVMGLTIAPTMTNVNAMVQRIVHPSQLTEGLTWLSTFMNLGVAVGAACGGRMVDLHGARGGCYVVALSALATLIVGIGGAGWLRTSLHKADERRRTVWEQRHE